MRGVVLPDISRAAQPQDRSAQPICALVDLCLPARYGFGREKCSHAGVAELVDARDLGSRDESRGGSNPSARTTQGRQIGREVDRSCLDLLGQQALYHHGSY